MKLEIWSDVVCPWCYVGKRRLEAALAEFDHRAEVEITWHSFELDPAAPRQRDGDSIERLAAKYGMTAEQARASQEHLTTVAAREGLDFHLDTAKSGNTLDAHRLIHMAAGAGLQDAVKERLLSAYLVEGQPIGDRATLARLVGEVGLDADKAAEVLAGDDYVDEVRADEAEARALGISGVPFFVFDRTFAVSGAQPVDVFVAALEKAWASSQPFTVLAADGEDQEGACTGDSCVI